MVQLYKLPSFLEGRIDRKKYIRWLERIAKAHTVRDRLRLNSKIALSDYKMKIHRAAESSNGLDWYTGEYLEWEKISTYSNTASQAARSVYKATFALQPTVDHVRKHDGTFDFVICASRTNSAKCDLSLVDFVQLCQRVIKLHG